MPAARLTVLAPLPGRIVGLGELSDEVFAQEMVGPGLAIDPPAGVGTLTVVSPAGGLVGALQPHAFAIEAEGGDVLVHLGLDTVTLQGAPFTVKVGKGHRVAAGQEVVQWDVQAIGALDPVVPVIALAAPSIEPFVSPGDSVEPGDPLFIVGTV